MLWAFHFEPGRDLNGNPVYPDPDATTSNVTRRPTHFACVLTPRTGEIADIVRDDAQRAEEALKEWE